MCSASELRACLAVLTLSVAGVAAAAPPAADLAQRGAGRADAILRALQPAPAAPASGIAARELRVCADPNNLPFSNKRGEGFENAIAQLLADELGRPLRYTWQPQRRGFIRNTLASGACDLVVGVPAGYPPTATTAPYYRSSYVFVTRRDRGLAIASFDDTRLRTLRLGVHVVGDDYNNVPPAQALAWRHIIDNLHGYPIYGDYSQPDPARNLIDAVASGAVDVAIAWGPLAGYFASREPAPLVLAPVQPQLDHGSLPMTFAIAMGVRRGDLAFRDLIDHAIAHRQRDIATILTRYGVPLVDGDHAPRVAAKE
jgi:quinoprotein dehydrogenase-associated probable ABC transporter substrate-binding protein